MMYYIIKKVGGVNPFKDKESNKKPKKGGRYGIFGFERY